MARMLGKLAPSNDPRTLRLAKYIDAARLPPTPPAIDWGARIAADGWPMMANDRVGDCTVAAAGHLIQCWTSNTSDAGAVVVPDAQILAAYAAVTGYDPARPQSDTGAVETDVLDYWRRAGIDGHVLGAYAAVDPQRAEHLRAAIDLFGGAYCGIALPETAQTQRTWSISKQHGLTGPGAPGSWGGHAVPLVGYRPDPAQPGRWLFSCVTWGERQEMTQEFVRHYMDEAYALIAAEWVGGTRAAPSGFDLAALLADLRAL